MVGKKGWIRTLEAVIAILLVLGFILFITPKDTTYTETTPQIVESAQNFILKELMVNENIRNCVLLQTGGSECNVCGDLNQIITENTPPGYTINCEICDGSASCTSLGKDVLEKSVYTSAVMLASQETKKVVRLYLWES